MFDNSVTLSAFFRCGCGKLHCRAGVRLDSVCVCEARLWPVAMMIEGV